MRILSTVDAAIGWPDSRRTRVLLLMPARFANSLVVSPKRSRRSRTRRPMVSNSLTFSFLPGFVDHVTTRLKLRLGSSDVLLPQLDVSFRRPDTGLDLGLELGRGQLS